MTNPDVVVTDVDVLSDRWGTVRMSTVEQRRRDGSWQTLHRETYDRGNGSVVLPYDLARRTVLLTQQFRFPAYVNGHPAGMLVEAAAGIVEAGEDPLQTVRREAEEELGVRLGTVEHLFHAYMSPGATTERIDFYAAAYDASSRIGDGGGLVGEGEDIEVLELRFEEALGLITAGGIVDAKTMMLLQWAGLSGPFAD